MRTPLLLLVLLAACAPAREEGDGTVPIGNDYETALFTVEEQGEGALYELGHLVLVNEDVGCGNLSWSGDLDLWSLEEGVEYLSLWLQRGVALDGWAMEYESAQRWSMDGNVWSDEMHHFWGQRGTTDGAIPPDGEDTGPPPEGRDVDLNIGSDPAGVDHLLRVLEDDAEHLAGHLDLDDSTVSFNTERCETIVREDQPPVPG